MDDAMIKPLKTIVKEEVKVLHGEVAKVKKEMSGLQSSLYLKVHSMGKLEGDVARIDSRLEDQEHTLATHTNKLDDHNKILKSHSVKLDDHTKTLSEHTELLKSIGKQVGDNMVILTEHSEKLDKMHFLLRLVAKKLGIELPTNEL